jgi:hypothetical protein
LNRFPYAIIFQHCFSLIRIIAVTNLHRRPFYWKDRV